MKKGDIVRYWFGGYFPVLDMYPYDGLFKDYFTHFAKILVKGEDRVIVVNNNSPEWAQGINAYVGIHFGDHDYVHTLGISNRYMDLAKYLGIQDFFWTPQRTEPCPAIEAVCRSALSTLWADRQAAWKFVNPVGKDLLGMVGFLEQVMWNCKANPTGVITMF